MNDLAEITREKISSIALKFLSKRELSTAELRKKLVEKFSEQSKIIEDILAEFREKKWLCDERFCEIYLKEKAQYSNWGEQKIVWKLKEKGISEAIIQAILPKIFPKSAQVAKAQKLVEQKFGSEWINENFAEKQKMKSFLANKGFSYEVISAVF